MQKGMLDCPNQPVLEWITEWLPCDNDLYSYVYIMIYGPCNTSCIALGIQPGTTLF